jgi:hypothetical protein
MVVVGSEEHMRTTRDVTRLASCPPAAMDDEVQEHQNPYPAPPAHYVRYTDHHLDLLALLRARPDEAPDVVLADKTDVPPWALGELEPPRADWILEDGGTVEMFGELWNVRAGREQRACASG